MSGSLREEREKKERRKNQFLIDRSAKGICENRSFLMGASYHIANPVPSNYLPGAR